MSETEYLISEAGGSDQRSGDVAAGDEGGHEVLKGSAGRVIEIVKAWKRGRLLPRSETPMLQWLYGGFDPPPPVVD